jgi:Domain of unknown function (DUF6438)
MANHGPPAPSTQSDTMRVPLRLMRVALLVVAPILPLTVAAQRSVPDDMIIIMARGNCEDGCPVYRILIFGNGDFIWQGRTGVAHRGVIQATIEPDRIRSLIQQFVEVDYFKLEDIYGYHGSGCSASQPYKPMVLLSYSIGGQSKVLQHHDGCLGEISEKLTALEDAIDRAVQAQRLITGKSVATQR